ncbi:spermidine synthase [Parasphingorhabdus pacifica]
MLDGGAVAAEHVARASSERGEVVLLRRGDDGALELRVNGIFVMDTAHTATERLLASTTLNGPFGDAIQDGARVLIGGLGLGFTLDEVLSDPRVAEAHVVEIEPAVVEWNRRGLVTDTASALRDERVRVSTGDVADVLAGSPPDSVDVILLDVDNGPGFLVYEANAAVYRRAFLSTCAERLPDGGLVAVWSANEAPELVAELREVFGGCQEAAIPVELGSRNTHYHLFVARRAFEDDRG